MQGLKPSKASCLSSEKYSVLQFGMMLQRRANSRVVAHADGDHHNRGEADADFMSVAAGREARCASVQKRKCMLAVVH